MPAACLRRKALGPLCGDSPSGPGPTPDTPEDGEEKSTCVKAEGDKKDKSQTDWEFHSQKIMPPPSPFRSFQPDRFQIKETTRNGDPSDTLLKRLGEPCFLGRGGDRGLQPSLILTLKCSVPRSIHELSDYKVSSVGKGFCGWFVRVPEKQRIEHACVSMYVMCVSMYVCMYVIQRGEGDFEE